MMRLGVITNPGSQRNKTDPAITRALKRHPGIMRRTFTGTEDIDALMRELAAEEVTDLVIDGGDGTIVTAISAAIRCKDFRRTPRFAIIPSGMTNLIAKQFGIVVDRDAAIDRLAGLSGNAAAVGTVRGAPLRVERPGLPDMHGFLFGAAAFHRGTLLSWEKVHPLGATQEAAAGLGILANIWRAVFGADRKAFLAGDQISTVVDGEKLPGDRRFIFLATTLDQLVLGLRPFWGSGPGTLRWLDVEAPPKSLFRALPRILLQRPAGWMEKAGYRSGKAERVTLLTRRPFVLDGEILEAGPEGRIDLIGEEPVEFIRLSPR